MSRWLHGFLAIVSTILAISCEGETLESRAEVWFTRPIPVSDALQLASDHRLKVVYINQSLVIDNDTLTIFHSADDVVNAAPDSIKTIWLQGYDTFLRDIAPTVSETADDESRNQLERLEFARKQVGELLVTGLTVIGVV